MLPVGKGACSVKVRKPKAPSCQTVLCTHIRVLVPKSISSESSSSLQANPDEVILCYIRIQRTVFLRLTTLEINTRWFHGDKFEVTLTTRFADGVQQRLFYRLPIDPLQKIFCEVRTFTAVEIIPSRYEG